MIDHLCFMCGYVCDCGEATVDDCAGCSPCAEINTLDSVDDYTMDELDEEDSDE